MMNKNPNPEMHHGIWFAPGDCKRFVKKKYHYKEHKCTKDSEQPCVPACQITGW